MEIRNLSNDERSDALILARDVLFADRKGQDDEKTLSLLKQRTEDLAMLGAYEDSLAGVLLYEPESMRIVLTAVRNEAEYDKVTAALVRKILQEAGDMHLVRVRLNTPQTGKKFFAGLGFEICGEEENGIVAMEYLMQKEWLGRTVTVIIDRPYGSFHPHLPDVLYPVNFGYIRELADGAGQFQDAYVIGPKEPAETFTGIVAGILYRREDDVSRWIVTRPGETVSHESIISLIGFEEQYYDCRIIWAEDK